MTTTPATAPARQPAVTAGDINIWHARLLADQQITYVVELDGRLETGLLRVALAALANALPLLSCVMQVRGRQFRWAPRAGLRPSLTIVEGEPHSPEALARFIHTPTDPQREPMLKLFLLRQAERDTLAVKGDHMLADAAGLKHVLSLLAEAYSTGEVRQTTNPDRGFAQVLRTFPLPGLVGALRAASVPRPVGGLVAGPFQPGEMFLEHACLDTEAFRRLRVAAKACGATINDAVVAAVYQAVFRRIGMDAPAYPLMVPVDMRRYLPEAQRGVVGNLSSAIYPSLAPQAGEDIRGLLSRLLAVIEPLKNDNPGLGPMLLMALGALWGGEMIRRRYASAAPGGARYINVTNFGIIERKQASFRGTPTAEVYGVGPVQFAPGILLALSSYDGVLHLTVQSNDAARFQPFVRVFLRDVLEGLQRLSE